MSSVVVQALVLALGGAVGLALTVWLTRRGVLSLRFGVGWLVVCSTLLLGAVVAALDLVRPLAEFLHFTPTGLIVGFLGFFLLAVSLQLSVALSHAEHASRRLAQEQALLEERVQRLEES